MASNSHRSVSPFGQSAQEAQPFAELAAAVAQAFPLIPEGKPTWQKLEDAAFIPGTLRRIAEAPANDAPELNPLCSFLVRHSVDLEAKGIEGLVFSAMEQLFHTKTEIFLINHYDREACEKMGWQDESRDVALFSKERDALIGNYFAPATDRNPGRFSEVINRWVESENVDRLLHFLDFCRGSKNPTFEYYLVFSHPALQRVIRNKAQMKSIHAKALPLISKLQSVSDIWSF